MAQRAARVSVYGFEVGSAVVGGRAAPDTSS